MINQDNSFGGPTDSHSIMGYPMFKYKVFRVVFTKGNKFTAIMKAKWYTHSLGEGTRWRYLEDIKDKGYGGDTIAEILSLGKSLGSNLLIKSPEKFSKAIAIFDLPENFTNELISHYETFNKEKQSDYILVEKNINKNGKKILDKLSKFVKKDNKEEKIVPFLYTCKFCNQEIIKMLSNKKELNEEKWDCPKCGKYSIPIK